MIGLLVEHPCYSQPSITCLARTPASFHSQDPCPGFYKREEKSVVRLGLSFSLFLRSGTRSRGIACYNHAVGEDNFRFSDVRQQEWIGQVTHKRCPHDDDGDGVKHKTMRFWPVPPQ